MQQRVPQMLGRQPQHSTFNPNANTFIPRQSNYHPMPQQAMQQNNLQQYGHNPVSFEYSFFFYSTLLLLIISYSIGYSISLLLFLELANFSRVSIFFL